MNGPELEGWLEGWITTVQAAKLTGYKRAHIRYLLKEGHIPSRRVGRDWLVYKESLLEYKAHMDRLGKHKHNPWREDLPLGKGRRLKERIEERRTTMADKGLLDGIARCGVHDCPMIQIDDHYVCVVEYANSQLGMHQITHVVPGTGSDPTLLEFDNGLSLPLLCPCCGNPLHIGDFHALAVSAVGLYLVAIGSLPKDGELPDALEFVLAPDGMLENLPDEIVDPLPEGFQLLQLHTDCVRGLY